MNSWLERNDSENAGAWSIMVRAQTQREIKFLRSIVLLSASKHMWSVHDYCVVFPQLQCRMVIASKQQNVPVMMSVLLINNSFWSPLHILKHTIFISMQMLVAFNCIWHTFRYVLTPWLRAVRCTYGAEWLGCLSWYHDLSGYRMYWTQLCSYYVEAVSHCTSVCVHAIHIWFSFLLGWTTKW